MFLCAEVKALEPAQDVTEEFGEFKDLNKPFTKPDFSHLSPVPLDLDLGKNYRHKGHSGPINRGFERPKSRNIDPNSFAQDATAALLERLFPNCHSFLVNSSLKDQVNKWLKPENIALLFNVIYSDSFYERVADEAILLLAQAMQPALFVNRNGFYQHHPNSLKKFPIKCLSFAELLYTALRDNLGDRAPNNGYPLHVVERILLTFMWEKKQTKLDLKPFYEALSDTLIDKTKLTDIIWAGKGSCFVEADYWAARQAPPQNDLEIRALLKLGYPVFEDEFPPVISYGVAYMEIDGDLYPYADCGGTALRNFFMHMLYNVTLNRFEWERLEYLKSLGFQVNEELIYYFRYICPRPALANKPRAQNAWSNRVMLNLNKGITDEKLKVRLLHPNPENGTFGIDAGLDNMLKVIRILCGITSWGKEGFDVESVKGMLTHLCELFSNLGHTWSWALVTKPFEKPERETSVFQNQRIKDMKDVSLVFRFDKKSIFEWHFERAHFGFNPAVSTVRALDYYAYNRTHEFPPSTAASAIPLLFYDTDMQSPRGQFIAMQRAIWYKRTYHKDTYDHLIESTPIIRHMTEIMSHHWSGVDFWAAARLRPYLDFKEGRFPELFYAYGTSLMAASPLGSDLYWEGLSFMNRSRKLNLIFFEDVQPNPYCYKDFKSYCRHYYGWVDRSSTYYDWEGMLFIGNRIIVPSRAYWQEIEAKFLAIPHASPLEVFDCFNTLTHRQIVDLHGLYKQFGIGCVNCQQGNLHELSLYTKSTGECLRLGHISTDCTSRTNNRYKLVKTVSTCPEPLKPLIAFMEDVMTRSCSSHAVQSFFESLTCYTDEYGLEDTKLP